MASANSPNPSLLLAPLTEGFKRAHFFATRPWTLHSTYEQHIRIYQQDYSNDEPTAFKLTGIIGVVVPPNYKQSFTAQTLALLIDEAFNTPQQRLEWDDSLQSMVVHEQVNTCVSVLHGVAKPMIGGLVSAREFVKAFVKFDLSENPPVLRTQEVIEAAFPPVDGEKGKNEVKQQQPQPQQQQQQPQPQQQQQPKSAQCKEFEELLQKCQQEPKLCKLLYSFVCSIPDFQAIPAQSSLVRAHIYLGMIATETLDQLQDDDAKAAKSQLLEKEKKQQSPPQNNNQAQDEGQVVACRFHMIVHTNAGGSIPQWLVKKGTPAQILPVFGNLNRYVVAKAKSKFGQA